MDIQGRTQPSYRSRDNDQPAGDQQRPSIAGVVAQPAPQQPSQASVPTPTVDNVISGGTVPTPHPKEQVDVESIIQDVKNDPKLAPEQITTPQDAKPGQNIAQSTQAPKPPKSHSKMPIIVAIIALLVAAGLAFVAYMAFNEKNDEAQPKTTTVNRVNVRTESTALPKPDINSTNQLIDENINSLDETRDFNAAELSDQSLGL